ncbi:MAG: HAD-IIB family hydrolase [Myxococcota bacterium]
MSGAPKPFSELHDDVLRAVPGVVFDIDDTLTREGRLELPAFRALWRLADAGLVGVAITGRPLGWVDVIARQWPVSLAVGENGAGWVRRNPDGSVTEGYFADPEEREAHRQIVARIKARVAREMPDIVVSRDDRARRCDLAFDVAEEESVPKDRIAKLAALIEAEGCAAPVSSVHAHAVPGRWDKAVGAEKAIRDALGVELDFGRWIFIGDSGNDAAAFARFDLSIGVANVRERALPRPPKWITAQDRGRGFAEVVDRLLAVRGPATVES